MQFFSIFVDYSIDLRLNDSVAHFCSMLIGFSWKFSYDILLIHQSEKLLGKTLSIYVFHVYKPHLITWTDKEPQLTIEQFSSLLKLIM